MITSWVIKWQQSVSQMEFIGAYQNDPLGIGTIKRALDKLQDKKSEKY